MKAIRKATALMLGNPQKAWKYYVDFKPQLNNELSYKQFQRSFVYFSLSLYNVHRDWKRVTAYAKRLEIVPSDFSANYTNQYLEWEEPEEVEDPLEAQQNIKAHQESCRNKGGFFKRVSTTQITSL